MSFKVKADDPECLRLASRFLIELHRPAQFNNENFHSRMPYGTLTLRGIVTPLYSKSQTCAPLNRFFRYAGSFVSFAAMQEAKS